MTMWVRNNMIVGYCNVFISCCKRVKYYSSSELDTIVSAATVLCIFLTELLWDIFYIRVNSDLAWTEHAFEACKRLVVYDALRTSVWCLFTIECTKPNELSLILLLSKQLNRCKNVGMWWTYTCFETMVIPIAIFLNLSYNLITILLHIPTGYTSVSWYVLT